MGRRRPRHLGVRWLLHGRRVEPRPQHARDALPASVPMPWATGGIQPGPEERHLRANLGYLLSNSPRGAGSDTLAPTGETAPATRAERLPAVFATVITGMLINALVFLGMLWALSQLARLVLPLVLRAVLRGLARRRHPHVRGRPGVPGRIGPTGDPDRDLAGARPRVRARVGARRQGDRDHRPGRPAVVAARSEVPRATAASAWPRPSASSSARCPWAIGTLWESISANSLRTDLVAVAGCSGLDIRRLPAAAQASGAAGAVDRRAAVRDGPAVPAVSMDPRRDGRRPGRSEPRPAAARGGGTAGRPLQRRARVLVARCLLPRKAPLGLRDVPRGLPPRRTGQGVRQRRPGTQGRAGRAVAVAAAGPRPGHRRWARP